VAHLRKCHRSNMEAKLLFRMFAKDGYRFEDVFGNGGQPEAMESEIMEILMSFLRPSNVYCDWMHEFSEIRKFLLRKPKSNSQSVIRYRKIRLHNASKYATVIRFISCPASRPSSFLISQEIAPAHLHSFHSPRSSSSSCSAGP
jgi:hypothetical protein